MSQRNNRIGGKLMKVNIANKGQTSYDVEVIDGITHITITEKIVIDRADFEQRVKVVLLLTNQSQYEICRKLGVLQSNFLTRCRTGKLTFDEQRRIAEALGCKIVVKFTFDDGAEYIAETARQLIVDSCAHAKITLTELSIRLGKSKQTFNSKLNNGRFTDSELADIANKIGCTYSNYFELKDGTHI